MRWLLLLVIAGIDMMIVSATKESLELHGSPELGYYVALAIGDTRDQVVSVFVMFVNTNVSQSNCSSTFWWTLEVVTLSSQDQSKLTL